MRPHTPRYINPRHPQPARHRYDDILSVALHPDGYLVSIRDVRDVMLNSRAGGRERCEQEAFIRLLTGYEDTTAAGVAAVFRDVVAATQSWQAVCASVHHRLRERNVENRLITMDMVCGSYCLDRGP
jgi:hypothetical protein